MRTGTQPVGTAATRQMGPQGHGNRDLIGLTREINLGVIIIVLYLNTS